MRILMTVVKKELLDLFRDRKTVGISFLMGPLLMPLLILGIASVSSKRMTTQLESRLELPVMGAEHAPNLMEWLKSQNVVIKDPPADPEAQIALQNLDIVLSIKKDFPEKWLLSEPAPVEILADTTRENTRIVLDRLEGLLSAYGRSAGALRLLLRGVNPMVSQPILVARKDLATPESRVGQSLIFLPYLLILFGFLGGSFLVIDVTAGERERQTLEPLLTTPTSRTTIMNGKILAACIFGILSLFLNLLVFKISFFLTPYLGLKMDLSWFAAFQILVALIPIILIGTCLLTFISAGVKSVKEAQSYMSLLMLLPIVPTVILMINPMKNQLWMFAIPFLSTNQMILKLVRSESISLLQWTVYLAFGIGLGGLLWMLAARRYHQERLAVSA